MDRISPEIVENMVYLKENMAYCPLQRTVIFCHFLAHGNRCGIRGRVQPVCDDSKVSNLVSFAVDSSTLS
jgi:hypothetical protein